MNRLSRLRSTFSFTRNNMSGLVSSLVFFLVALVTFIIGLAASFPDDAILTRLEYALEQNLPAQVSIKYAEYSFPFSITAENVQIRMNEPNMPEIDLDMVSLTPHLSSLIGKPGACFDIAIGNGQISGSVAQSGELSVEVNALSFDEPIQGFPSLSVSGRINSANLDSHLRPEAETPTAITLQANDLKLSGTRNAGLGIDQVNFGQLELQLGGKGKNLMVQKATVSGGDLTATATGRIVIGRTITATRLNLEAQFKPTTSLDSSVSSLFELIGAPGNDGARKVNIRGTLAYPKIK